MAIPKREKLSLKTFIVESKSAGPNTCKLMLYLKEHPEDAAMTFEAIEDPTISIAAIHRTLARRGYTGARESINRTRQGCPHCNRLKSTLKREAR
jgi:hypothetical protein